MAKTIKTEKPDNFKFSFEGRGLDIGGGVLGVSCSSKYVETRFRTFGTNGQ